MRAILLLALLFFFPLAAKLDPSAWDQPTAREEESLFLRRIAEFWQEGEYAIAQNQIEEFLLNLPESPYADPLRICLADLYVQESDYAKGLSCYEEIVSEELEETVFLNKIQCLYHLGRDLQLAELCEKNLENLSNPEDKKQAEAFLAASLYRQCLQADFDRQLQIDLAKKTEPYLENLCKTTPEKETAEALAHICQILENFPKAAAIYLKLSEEYPDNADEMEFQAAEIQMKYDRPQALGLLQKLSQSQTPLGSEAAYLVLKILFESENYEEILANQDHFFSRIAENKRDFSLLLIGKSLLALQLPEKAIEILQTAQGKEASDPILLALIEAAYQCRMLDLVETTIPKLSAKSPFAPQAKLFYALLLKEKGLFDAARCELQDIVASSENPQQKQRSLLELIMLEYQNGSWQECARLARSYLQFDNNPMVWKILASASGQIAAENKEDLSFSKLLVDDLEALLAHQDLFSPDELSDWKFFLAKGWYSLGNIEKTIQILENNFQINEQNKTAAGTQEGNSHLLLALCYRDALNDEAAFCLHAEEAIEKKADLVDSGSLAIALFNAYLNLSQKAPQLVDKAAEHLFRAFEANAPISQENLFWLSNKYLDQPQLAEKILFFLINTEESREKALYQLGILYAKTKQWGLAINYLEQLVSIHSSAPSIEKNRKNKTSLLLAKAYAAIEKDDLALKILDSLIDQGPAIHSKTIAKASLLKSTIQIKQLKTGLLDASSRAQIAAQLKNLVLQKNLAFEPLHLEAALEYVDLLSDSPEKRLSLLEKTKRDFESGEDLIAQDYMHAREKLKKQNRIYESYMRFIDEEIFLVKSALAIDFSEQKQLQAKAKDLLLQIKEEDPHTLLAGRIFSRLQTEQLTDASVSN